MWQKLCVILKENFIATHLFCLHVTFDIHFLFPDVLCFCGKLSCLKGGNMVVILYVK